MSSLKGAIHSDRIKIDLNYFLNRSNVDVKNCWLWILALSPTGYGEAKANGRRVRAHRLAYQTLVGPIPHGLHIDHLCKVRACVNPAHLEAVTAWENNIRSSSPSALNAVKTHCLRGHKFVESNIYRRPDKPADRSCRKCLRLRDLKRKGGYSN